MSGPTLDVQLEWTGGLCFKGRSAAQAMDLDGDGRAGVSPVQALGFAVAGCMSADVAHILAKARLPLQGLTAALHAERAAEEPRRLTAVRLHFTVRGDVPPERVERAIALSREKYCSVWHSLRPDLDFRTSFEVTEQIR